MGMLMLDAVGTSQVFQPETGEAVFVFWPHDAVRAQRIAGAHHIEQIPTRITVLPAVGVGIVEAAVENITADFVVEADVVVTENAGARHAERLMDLPRKFGLVDAFG